MAKQAKGTKKSTNPNTSGRKRAGVGGGNRPPRAHRDDTPEARAQGARTAKTHPRANTGARAAARKDK
jgi:hypothetical protein